MTQPASPPPDAVSDVLRTFGVRSTIFCLSEFRAPWAFRVSGEPVGKFHLVLEGSALLSCGDASVSLAAGDLVVLPRGSGHSLADGRDTPAPLLDDLIAEYGLEDGMRLRYGGSGHLTRLLCGGFSLSDGIPVATLRLFPDVLHVPSRGGTSWLATLLRELKAESEAGQPGASAIVAKVTDVFLAQALRTWIVGGSTAGFADPRRILDEPIAKAVQALNDHPSEAWSLDRLGQHVGLSRTALATRFRDRVGEPPMRYLSDVRLRRAAEELVGGRLTLHEVAQHAAYATDASFAKAFKRRFGMPPGMYRDTAGEAPLIELATVP